MEVLGLVDIPLTLVLVVLLFVFVYVYQTWLFNTWKNLGISGPTPRIFLGNIPIGKKMNLLESLEENKAKYGRTYGMFLFRDPLLATSDPEVIKEVMVKQFNNFTDRHSGFDNLLSEFAWMMLFNSRGQAWRRYRHVMTPVFTTGKLKALEGHIIRCSGTLKEILEEKASRGEDIDLKDTYQRFTMDVIAGTAFGLDTSLQRGHGQHVHAMIQAMQGVLANIGKQFVVFLAVSFPFLGSLMRRLGYTAFPKKDLDFFKQCITNIIRERDQNPQEAKNRVDFLQQMLDIRVAPGEEVTNTEEVAGQTKTNKKLTEEEVVAQGFQMFTAGFETTASTLRYLTYCLALYPEVQEKVLQEILQVVGNEELKYEHLQKLKYLDCVILETLRMYPIVPTLSRRAKEAVEIQGYSIPPGMGVMLAIYTATHDPDIYPYPNTFTPDRFSDGKDSLMASLPFGWGPRQCIGMRLAMQELKTTMATVCRTVRFVPCESTPKTLEFDDAVLLTPKQPIIVRAEIRTKTPA